MIFPSTNIEIPSESLAEQGFLRAKVLHLLSAYFFNMCSSTSVSIQAQKSSAHTAIPHNWRRETTNLLIRRFTYAVKS